MNVPREPLPPREPHPLSTHVAVDIAVVFLATLVLGLILGLSWLVILGIAVVAGACLAPYTRRTEERQLAEREHGGDRAADAGRDGDGTEQP